VETNDENIYARDNEFTEIRMPEVAQSYEQFNVRAEACGHDAACAICWSESLVSASERFLATEQKRKFEVEYRRRV